MINLYNPLVVFTTIKWTGRGAMLNCIHVHIIAILNIVVQIYKIFTSNVYLYIINFPLLDKFATYHKVFYSIFYKNRHDAVWLSTIITCMYVHPLIDRSLQLINKSRDAACLKKCLYVKNLDFALQKQKEFLMPWKYVQFTLTIDIYVIIFSNLLENLFMNELRLSYNMNAPIYLFFWIPLSTWSLKTEEFLTREFLYILFPEE